MRLFIYTALLVLIPVAAMACRSAPELATKEQIAKAVAPYHGFEAKILSVDTKVSGLPHDGFMARAQIIGAKSAAIPAEVSLVFGPCSIIPDVGSSYNFIVKTGMSRGYYEVQDHPASVIKPSR